MGVGVAGPDVVREGPAGQVRSRGPRSAWHAGSDHSPLHSSFRDRPLTLQQYWWEPTTRSAIVQATTPQSFSDDNTRLEVLYSADIPTEQSTSITRTTGQGPSGSANLGLVEAEAWRFKLSIIYFISKN